MTESHLAKKHWAGSRFRPVWAEVDLDAVRHNTRLMRQVVDPSQLCVVVKADAYGHGAVPVSQAALEAGASWLAVAMVEEGLELRQAGIEAPILLLSEPDPAALAGAIAAGLTPTLYTKAGIAAAAASCAGATPIKVHVKVDTGMHRAGADLDDAVSLVTEIEGDPHLELEGLWTHLAVAEDVGDCFTTEQLRRFDEVRERIKARGVRPRLVHAANSAAAITDPASRYDLVRCGISIYGYTPSPGVAAALAELVRSTGGGGSGQELRPVMSLWAKVSSVRRVEAADRISYGRLYRVDQPSVIATVPIGYADGVPRRLFDEGGQVLVNGARRPIAGTVTMDHVMVDCGSHSAEPGDHGSRTGGSGVAVGDDVVLLGSQGGETIDAEEWARRLGTISYEVLCGMGARVPRVVLNDASDVSDGDRS